MLLSFEKESHKSCPCPPYNAAFPTTWLVDLLWINLLLLLSSLNPQAIAQGPGAYDFRVTTSMAHVENHHHLWIQKAYVIWLVGTSSIHVESSWNNCSLHKLYHQNPVQHTVTLQSYTTIKSHKSKHPPKKKMDHWKRSFAGKKQNPVSQTFDLPTYSIDALEGLDHHQLLQWTNWLVAKSREARMERMLLLNSVDSDLVSGRKKLDHQKIDVSNRCPKKTGNCKMELM